MAKDVRVGSSVAIQIPNGIGRFGQEWKTVKAKVKMVLPTYIVCMVGNNEAHPRVAESWKLLRW